MSSKLKSHLLSISNISPNNCVARDSTKFGPGIGEVKWVAIKQYAEAHGIKICLPAAAPAAAPAAPAAAAPAAAPAAPATEAAAAEGAAAEGAAAAGAAAIGIMIKKNLCKDHICDIV